MGIGLPHGRFGSLEQSIRFHIVQAVDLCHVLLPSAFGMGRMGSMAEDFGCVVCRAPGLANICGD